MENYWVFITEGKEMGYYSEVQAAGRFTAKLAQKKENKKICE